MVLEEVGGKELWVVLGELVLLLEGEGDQVWSEGEVKQVALKHQQSFQTDLTHSASPLSLPCSRHTKSLWRLSWWEKSETLPLGVVVGAVGEAQTLQVVGQSHHTPVKCYLLT